MVAGVWAAVGVLVAMAGVLFVVGRPAASLRVRVQAGAFERAIATSAVPYFPSAQAWAGLEHQLCYAIGDLTDSVLAEVSDPRGAVDIDLTTLRRRYAECVDRVVARAARLGWADHGPDSAAVPAAARPRHRRPFAPIADPDRVVQSAQLRIHMDQMLAEREAALRELGARLVAARAFAGADADAVLDAATDDIRALLRSTATSRGRRWRGTVARVWLRADIREWTRRAAAARPESSGAVDVAAVFDAALVTASGHTALRDYAERVVKCRRDAVDELLLAETEFIARCVRVRDRILGTAPTPPVLAHPA